ncbi:MAG: ClbS/DfsB family four-helix bundle protein [Anaerolineales bacterium]|nr:ClbS/DfsB family four-helix bundle protein [Anaerolineales bacterium]
MNLNESLVKRLEASRAEMLAHLEVIDKDRKIYPLWTVREIIAHLSGWDDATIGFIRAIMAGEIPPTPAMRGMDVYNAETVATREGLDYDHIYREYVETRNILLDLIRAAPEEKITQKFILPWGGEGTLMDIINIFGPHEEEHAEDVRKIIENAGK